MPLNQTLEIMNFGVCRGFQLPGFRQRMGISRSRIRSEWLNLEDVSVAGEERRDLVQGAGERPRGSTSAGRMPMIYGSDFSIQEPPHPSLMHT